MEGRRHRKAGTFEGNMAETLGSTTVSTKLERIAQLAREMPQAALDDTCPSHRYRLAARSASGARARTEPPASTGRQPKSTRGTWRQNLLLAPLECVKSGQLRGATGSESAHPEGGGWLADAAHRHTNLRGQGASTGGGYGAGGGLRAEFSATAHTAFGRDARRIRRCDWCRTRR